MQRVVKLTMVLALLGASLAAAAMKNSGDVVKAEPGRTKLSAAAGDLVTFQVNVEIANHWHLYAHGDTNFIGIDLVPAEGFPLADYSAVYPEGKEGEFYGEKVFMIEGDQVIKAQARVPAGLAAGHHELKLELTVQACDDKTCLAPANLPLNLLLTVE